MRWSIRYQLLVPLATLLLGVLGISSWTAWASAERARQQMEKQVRDVARTLAAATYPLTGHVLEQMKGLSGAEFVLLTAEGRRTSTLDLSTAALPAAEPLAEDWHALRLGLPTRLGERTYLCSGMRLASPRVDGGQALYILYPESLWRDAQWEAVRPALVLGSLLGFASLALTLGLGRRLNRRIDDLAQRTKQIAQGDFQPVPLTGPADELRELGESINAMAQQLAQLHATMQKTERLRLLGQVSGGLAHQVRNGVTGASLAVQLHARECTSGADVEALHVALRQLALVEANLKRFLDLGREAVPGREACDLLALLDQAVSLYRPQCKHAGIALTWQRPEHAVTLRGDRGRLQHLVLNLLSNAIEAAGPDGSVQVVLEVAAISNPCAILEIRDSGPGPPAELANRLFEPFATGKRDGVGLGLAVARQAAEAHGGTLRWYREAGRTVFRTELPLEVAGEPPAAG